MGGIIGTGDAPALSDSSKNCYLGFLGVDDGYYGRYKTVNDGDIIAFGDEKITVVGCPGHTPGGVSYQINDVVFCGDTVFAGGGYGRWDLPSGDYTSLRNSITKIVSLPDDTVLYPGHGDPTTVRDYKRDYFGKRV